MRKLLVAIPFLSCLVSLVSVALLVNVSIRADNDPVASIHYQNPQASCYENAASNKLLYRFDADYVETYLPAGTRVIVEVRTQDQTYIESDQVYTEAQNLRQENPGMEYEIPAASAGGEIIRTTYLLLDGKTTIASHYSGFCAPNPTLNYVDSFSFDGRLNMDFTAPVAIYGHNGGIQVYAIDPVAGRGQQVIDLSAAEVGEPLEYPIVFMTDTGVSIPMSIVLARTTNPFTQQPILLARLTTGEFQLNTLIPDESQPAGYRRYVPVWRMGQQDLDYIKP